MDLTATAITPNSSRRPQEADADTPSPTQPTKLTDHHISKPLSFGNGVLKRHHQNHTPSAVITYKECLKNHAASLGGHAVDGCGEFMPSPSATPTDPTSLKCAACGCHRNFHRREPDEGAHTLDYHHQHQQHTPHQPIVARCRSPNSASPPPLSSSYYPSAPHMLLALSTGLSGAPENHVNTTAAATTAIVTPNPNGRKRFRTKFSQEQKEKMYAFSERLGWKMQKSDEEVVDEFCNEIGVGKGVLKVWMHNNKHTFGKRDANGNRSSVDANENHSHSHHNDNSAHHVATNGSSSSS
ncbi:PREDICTED: zinc-finger homeodomain protein 9-like [Nelumbo nucifera]|uniref:ZF-HD dimerization-type domain-containing protein n=2 Tax=Nelumbo nucifera TaxID=4432 RepID=A0A822YAX3_NELNU|nr:PREDICTED: zinc-finger homeodomain protein 9-like [Nelumbo nucifera]DAD31254.1 TPA_asm: hypothetical protein HUJ06_010105 [Nelumbo nucifera]